MSYLTKVKNYKCALCGNYTLLYNADSVLCTNCGARFIFIDVCKNGVKLWKRLIADPRASKDCVDVKSIYYEPWAFWYDYCKNRFNGKKTEEL